MRKNLKENKGVPLYVDYIKDLPAKEKALGDSWYIICNFEAEGKQVGFMWHTTVQVVGDGLRVMAAEFFLTDAGEDFISKNDIATPFNTHNGAESERMHIFSDWGEFYGDEKEMRLKLTVPDGGVDAVMYPRKNVLYDGTTGLVDIMGYDSHQYAFPNMDIEGTLTIRGKQYPIKNTTAWFDRQWGYTKPEKGGIIPEAGAYTASWLWLGLPLTKGHDEAVSLNDTYESTGRHAYATFLKADGTLLNEAVDITYDKIWKSEKTGNSYPREINISVPRQKLELKLEVIVSDPEYVHTGNYSGCQAMCKVTGSYNGEAVDQYVILENIGDLCGEE